MFNLNKSIPLEDEVKFRPDLKKYLPTAAKDERGYFNYGAKPKTDSSIRQSKKIIEHKAKLFQLSEKKPYYNTAAIKYEIDTKATQNNSFTRDTTKSNASISHLNKKHYFIKDQKLSKYTPMRNPFDDSSIAISTIPLHKMAGTSFVDSKNQDQNDFYINKKDHDEKCSNYKISSNSKPKIFHKRAMSEAVLKNVDFEGRNFATINQDSSTSSKNLMIKSFQTRKNEILHDQNLKTELYKETIQTEYKSTEKFFLGKDLKNSLSNTVSPKIEEASVTSNKDTEKSKINSQKINNQQSDLIKQLNSSLGDNSVITKCFDDGKSKVFLIEQKDTQNNELQNSLNAFLEKDKNPIDIIENSKKKGKITNKEFQKKKVLESISKLNSIKETIQSNSEILQCFDDYFTKVNHIKTNPTNWESIFNEFIHDVTEKHFFRLSNDKINRYERILDVVTDYTKHFCRILIKLKINKYDYFCEV